MPHNAKSTPRIVAIGAGIGGLTTAAVLAKAGYDVTMLEAHVYPGGCAGTFFHKGFRFDAGATLAGGFYPGGPMDLVAKAAGIDAWPAHSDSLAMVVHLPDGSAVPRWTDDRRHAARRAAFGAAADKFFGWQERTADVMWDLALRTPPWPPQSTWEASGLLRAGAGWLATAAIPSGAPISLMRDAFRPVSAHLHDAPPALRQFVDAQLLISAQTTSPHANALYGASALDLPRRGIVHAADGMGGIAKTLADAVQRNGGDVRYRQEVVRIEQDAGQLTNVITKRGESFPVDIIIANLTPSNLATLLGEAAPAKYRSMAAKPTEQGWGAFMLYLGLKTDGLPPDFPLHHQVLSGDAYGEGDSVYLSFSPDWDEGRALAGQRAVTLSTHTALAPWWDAFNNDRPAYEARKAAYVEKMLAALATALVGIKYEVSLQLPGTPVTFQRFTRRLAGWVGGFPQTNLWTGWGPQVTSGVWMVGDSIFPGQSTAAVALGGLRVARAVQHSWAKRGGM